MNPRTSLPTLLAIGGFLAILVGIHQELVHVAAGYDGRIVSGWGGSLNHEEYLLAGLGALAIGAAVASRRWSRLALLPVAAGGIVLFYALRASLQLVRQRPLYTETTTYDGATIKFVLGAEPFLLVAGGILLVGSGLLGWRRRRRRDDGDHASTVSSSSA
ncbi:LPXTG cell wall anchor domain-containing protein [Halobacteriales archaeon Cl-PHB]